MPTSLYQLWQQQVAAHPGTTALIDAVAGESFTFAELDADLGPALPRPTGNTPSFIRQTLAAWRDGIASIPIEQGSAGPPDGLELPRGTAHVKTTSGSTGTPRYVCFTAAQLAADADNIVRTMGLTPGRPNIGVISLAHSYGFSNLVLPLLLHGIPLILGGDPLPGSLRRALDSLPQSGGTLPGVPAMWRAWHKAACLDPTQIKTAISAGAPLSLELESTIYHDTGIKVHNFYGSSECGGIAYDRSPTPRPHQNLVGTPLDGVAISLTPDGCLTVHSAAVAESIWPPPTPDPLGAGEFRTSDLAEVSPDGAITLRGRASDLINVAGRKLDPGTIEAKLASHPSVDHCLVFGIDSNDPERVQEIVAIANAGDPSELRSYLAGQLPAWQNVRHWWITPELRPNTRGKLSRAEWRDRWGSRDQTG